MKRLIQTWFLNILFVNSPMLIKYNNFVGIRYLRMFFKTVVLEIINM